MIKSVFIIAGLSIALLLNACSDDELTPEDEIKQFIESGIEAAENRSSDDLAELVDEKYRDGRGLDKKQLSNLARLYFFKHKSIYLFSKINTIEFPTENNAQVTLHVAMAGSVISDVNALTSLRAEIFKFDLELIKQDEWLLQSAQWQRASMGDMQ